MKKMWKVLGAGAVAAGCCALAAKWFRSDKKKDADMADDTDIATEKTEDAEA